MNRLLSILIAASAVLFRLSALAQDDAPAAPASTNASDGLDKSSLELIVRKNIFDPTRVGLRRTRAPRAEYFTFCGGAFDGPRAVAFFSGAGASNRPLKPGDTINGFKVSDITFRSVKLQSAAGAPQSLAMGMSMRREANGPWKPFGDAAPPPESSDTAVSSDTPAPAPPANHANDSDILKKLRARRDDD